MVENRTHDITPPGKMKVRPSVCTTNEVIPLRTAVRCKQIDGDRHMSVRNRGFTVHLPSAGRPGQTLIFIDSSGWLALAEAASRADDEHACR